MYALHFGLSAAAFQLNPDPSFYFGSRAHAEVLADLRYGVFRSEGFIVVIGEAGLGKTTLVQTLLGELKPDKVAAAHLVTLPSGEGELMRAILAAFGVTGGLGTSKSQVLATLEAYLLTLVTRGQRALLVVDEAQNLTRDALEDLRMLSNLQLGTLGLLQIFLVGQPPLARLLTSGSMAQLRQRVIASCRLRALEAEETRAYVEHRLKHVGWSGRPTFEEAAFAAIHAWCEGVPRRINQLCERLLLSASLNANDLISRELVDQLALEQSSELAPMAPAQAAVSAGPVAPWRPPPLAGVVPEAPLLCVAGGTLELLTARTLSSHLALLDDAATLIIVTPPSQAETPVADANEAGIKPAHLEMHLAVNTAVFTRAMPEAMRRFDTLLDVLLPRGVLLLGDSDATLACALVAHKRGLPLARVDAGLRAGSTQDVQAMNAALLDRLAQVLYAADARAGELLHAEGLVAAAHAHGSPLVDLALVAEHRVDALAQVLKRCGADAEVARHYVFATVHVQPDDPWPADVAEVLRALRAQAPVLWLVDAGTRLAIGPSGFAARMQSDGVTLVEGASTLEQLALVRHAALLLVDVRRTWADAARALHVPALLFDAHGLARERPALIAGARVIEDGDEAAQALAALPRRADDPARHLAGGAAAHIAAHLSAWLATVQRR